MHTHTYFGVWTAADEHGDAFLDYVELPLVLLRRALQLRQLRTPLRPILHMQIKVDRIRMMCV